MHNIRIERLWVDVTTGFGGKWKELFLSLEDYYDLDRDSTAHIWLIHRLFLSLINYDAQLWSQVWNAHKMRLPDQGSQSPNEMYELGSYSHGCRGEILRPDENEDMDWDQFGIDFEDLQNRRLLTHHRQQNVDDSDPERPSWVDQNGEPPNLNQVPVDDPLSPLNLAQQSALNSLLMNFPTPTPNDGVSLASLWVHALSYCRNQGWEGF